MATEANIQESVCLKKGEREENALASEVFGEKVTELPGNQVKQLETSSYVAEIVNTPLATGKPTDESGIFFQALSVTMVISDEHSNTPDSFKAAKQTEPEDKETTENEEKAIESVTSSQDTAVEDIKETTEHATIVADFEDQELKETPREFVKEETEGKSVDAQEVTEQREIGSKNIEEQTSEESVEKIEKDETKEITPDIESEKGEQNGLLQAITSDTAISTHTKSQVETTEHEEEETKSDNPLIKEVCEEKEATENEVVKSRESIEEEADVGVSTQPTLVKESIKIEEKAIEKTELEISDSAIEKEQGDPDGVTSSKESPCVDAEETTTVQHVTAEINFKERDLDEKPREFIKEETEDKSIDAPEVSEECVKKEIEQNPEESVKKEEDIKPSVEVEEKKEQDELMPVITNDVTISTQTNPQVETTEHEEKEQDVILLEKDQDEDGVTHAQEVTFEKSLQEKSHPNEDNEHEAVKSKEGLEKEADTLVKESINIEEADDEKAIEKEICEISDSTAPSQKDQGDSDGVKSLQESPSVDVEETATDQHVTTEINLKEQDLNEKPKEFKEETEDKSLDAPEVSEECEKEAKEEIGQNPEESVKKIDKDDETEEIKPGVEIEEKGEQDELLPEITKDEVKHSAIATVTKDENEDEEKEQDVLEKDEGEHDATSARDVTFEKDLQEKNHHNEDDVTEVVTAEESTEKDTEVIKSSEETEQHMLINSIPSDVCISTQTEPVEGTTEKNDEEATETGQGLSALQRETIIEEAKDRSVAAQEETEQYDDGANDENEQKLDECVSETAHSTKEQEEHTEEIKPKVEATEEKDNGILTQTKFQEEATKNEENSIESDGVQKEKSDNPVVEELCEESDLKQTESKEEGQLSDSSNVKTRDIVVEDTEETKSSDVITTGVSSSTQTEYIEKAIESKENNDEGQKEKLENPLVEEVCEATSSKMAESEEGVKHSESSSMTPTVDETLSKEEEFEKKDDIKASEAQRGENDATSSQHASNEDIKETTIGQHDTTVAHVKEGQGVSTLPKEIPVEAGDKSIDDEEMSLKLGQPNPEDEIKKEDKDLSHESVEDTNDDSTKEKCTLEQEPVEEHSGQNEISKEIVTDLSETTEVEPQEDITPSTSFETSAEDASNSEKEKAESGNLPIEDLETTSQLQIPELVPKSEDSMLKEECVISEKELHLDEEIGTVTKEISSDEKTEVQRDGDGVTRSQNAPNEDIQESKIGQHDTTVSYVEEGLGVSATPKEILIEEAKDKSIDAKEISHASMEDTNDDTAKEEKCKLEQEPDEEHTGQDEVSKEKVTDLNETTEVEPQDDITPSISLETLTEETSNSEKENAETTEVEHSERDELSKENVADLNETTEVEPQEDITLSTSLKTSTEGPLNLEKEKAETENLSIEDLETVSEIKIPELVPKSEESVLKEECFISETKTHLNEENETVTKETSSDEKPEVQSGGEDVIISSQNEPSEDIKETTIGQHDTSVAYVEEGQGVSATPKEILIDQAEDKSIDAEETSLKLEQPNEQNVEETISQNPEDEIKKEDRDLLHNSMEDTNDDPAKEEKCAVEHEPIEEHSGLDDVSKVNVTELNETAEVEPQEDTENLPLEDTSNSAKEKAETENLPLEDLETVSEVQIPELVPKSEESVLKEDHFISETETHFDEEKRTVTEEISNDEKTELNKETVTEVCEETSTEKTEFEEEGLKLSDTSYAKINEKEITFKDEDEKDQEVIMSPKSQGEDNITSSQIEVSEEKEDLQKKNSHNEGNEDRFIKSGEGVHEDTEEIKSSVETQENTENVITTSSSTQIEPNADSIKNEEKNDEKAIVNDENEIVNRDAGLELKQEDIKETDMSEHATTAASIEEGQSLGTITKEILYEAEGDESVTGQEKTEQHDDGENDEEQKPEEHTEEIKPSVETNEENEVCISTQNESQEEPTKNEENVIEHDDQKKILDNLFVKEVCEESDSTKTESEERQVSDSSDVKTREIVDEDTEETILTDVSSSTQAENIEKTTAGDRNNDEETTVHDGQTEKPQSALVEVVYEATSSEIAESEEELKHSESFSTTLNENETLSKEEIQIQEDDIKTSEVKGSGVEVTSSQDTSNENTKETTIGQHDTTVAHVEEQCVSETPKETGIEEAEDKSVKAEEILLEHEEPNEQNVEETHPCPSETISGNPEDENKKENKELSLEIVEDTNYDTTKEEKYALKHESVEEHSGLDEVSKEKLTNINEAIEVEPKEDITPSTSLETSTEDISNSEKEKIETENFPIDLETVSEVQIPEVVPKSEESVLKEECFVSETETHFDEEKGAITEEISSDEKTEHTTEIKQETIKEVCEETSSEKAELEEGLKLSDTSDIKINEKELTTFKDDDQEINMSAESKTKNNITSSQNEESEEKDELQEKNDHNEDNEGGFIKSGESIHEEIKSTAETKENTEHVITTSCSRQIEPAEETIEKNGEKTIENGKNEITSRDIDLEKNPENVCSLTQTDSKEEILENKETNEEPIDSEKEQESAVPELHRGEDNAVSSRDAYNEDTKTAIGQDATTTVQFEEGLDVNAITKESTGEEVDDKSIQAEEASEQSENEAKTKIEQQPEESINKPVNSCSDTIEESIKEEADARNNNGIESDQEAENQVDKTEDRTEIKNEAVLAEKVSKELEQTKEQNVEEIEACLTETISEKTENKITKDEDLSHDSIEQINRNITKEEKCFPDVITKAIEISALEPDPVKEQNDSQDEVSKEKLTDLNEITVEPQEDTAPSSSLETSIEDTTNSDKAEAVNEYLPKDLEYVSEVHIPEVMPKLEDSKTKEECHVSATDIGTVTKDISSYENLETHESTQQPENSYSTTEENVTQSEVQLNNTEACSEIVKDVILTEEIEQVPLEIEKEKEINDFKEQIVEEDSYSPELEKKSAENQKELVHEISNSDSMPVENPDVTEVSVDGHTGQEDLQGKEDISCVSKVTTDVDQEPKEEGISSLEDAATVESEVDLSNRESTAYPLEGEKIATRALESDCDVKIPEVVADSEGSKVKEECVVLATAEYADENNVEKQDTKTDEISSAPDNEQETVTEAPTKSDEAKSSDLIIEEKALTKENLEIHGELEHMSESMIEQVIIETKPQPEQSEITCENIKNDQTSESKLEEEFTLASGNEIKSIESQNETTKNIILTDEVAVETEKEKNNEIEKQVSEKDNCPTELNSTSTPDQKELANEIEYSKPIADANTEVAEVKAEIQTEVEDIKAAEDLSCLSKASSNIETSKVEMHEDTEQITKIKEVKADSIYEASKDTTVPVLEDSKSSELQSTDRELVSELQTFSEDQTKINESCIESEGQGNFGAEIKEEKSEKEAVDDVIINEVIVEDEKVKESKSIKDIINEEAKLNQLTTQTDEVSQSEKSSSRPDELPGTKDSVEDTEELKFIADSLNVKDETLTVIKEPNEEKETVASEYKLENTVTDKEKEPLDEPQADDSLKTTYDSILSSTKPTEDSEIATEIVPECREVSAILTDNLPEASPEMLLAKHEDTITKDREVLPSVEKDVINAQKHEKDLDHETELRTADVVSDVECSEIKPSHLDTKEATLEFNNQENQMVQKKEADESIEAVIPVKDVKTSTREPEVVLVDLETPSVIDATAEKANNKTVETQLEPTCDQSKPTEESFGIKQEPSELDASKTLDTAAAEDLKISPRYVTDDLIEVSQTYPEVQKYEVPAGTESKILTEKIDSSHKQEEPVAEPLIPEAAKMKPDMTSVFIDQKEKSESVVPAKLLFQEHAKEKSEVAKDQQVDKEETEVKTDEEYEDEEYEDDEKTGSCSDAPVMVEASKDIEVKAHKKSHNILSGVGSKVKHSIAKVKKAITGKSSPSKPPSPKVKDQVIG